MTRTTLRERILNALIGRSRRRRLVSFVVLALGAAVVIDAVFVEPFALEITRRSMDDRRVFPPRLEGRRSSGGRRAGDPID